MRALRRAVKTGDFRYSDSTWVVAGVTLEWAAVGDIYPSYATVLGRIAPPARRGLLLRTK